MADAMPIIDTHLHLVYQARFSYPWLAGAPALDRDWTLEDYWAEAEPLGIIGALHMEVDVAPDDRAAETEFVTGLGAPILGAIAAARPEAEDFPTELAALAANRGVKGIRRILHTEPDALSQSDLFAANISRIGKAGLVFDLCMRADQLRLGEKLVARCPDTQIVLDHCGVPDIENGDFARWQADLAAIAAHPNAAAKISGIIAYGGTGWSLETLRPYVEHVIDRFGWDRVVWGSDHPVCTRTASLTQWVEATRALIADCTKAEQEKLLSANARRIYRIGGDT